MKINNILYIVAFIFPLMLSELSAQSLTQLQQQAAEQNKGLKASYQEFKIALESVPQARAFKDPQLSFGYFISPIETRGGAQIARFSLSQKLPWFGLKKAQENQARLQAEVAFQEFQLKKNQLFKRIAEHYFKLRYYKKKIRLEEENDQRLQNLKTLAEQNISSGEASLADVLVIKNELAASQAKRRSLEAIYNSEETRMNALLHQADTVKIALNREFQLEEQVHKELNARDTLADFPQLRAIAIQKQAAEIEKSIARKKGMPQFGIGLDYAVIAERGNFNSSFNGQDAFMPMLSISLPIFRGKYKAMKRQAELQNDRLENKMQQKQLDLKAGLQTLIYQLEDIRNVLASVNDQLLNSLKIYELKLSQYQSQELDLDELIRYQQDIIALKGRKLRLRRDLDITYYQYKYYTK
jgi:outer membrane protein TolC